MNFSVYTQSVKIAIADNSLTLAVVVSPRTGVRLGWTPQLLSCFEVEALPSHRFARVLCIDTRSCWSDGHHSPRCEGSVYWTPQQMSINCAVACVNSPTCLSPARYAAVAETIRGLQQRYAIT